MNQFARMWCSRSSTFSAAERVDYLLSIPTVCQFVALFPVQILIKVFIKCLSFLSIGMLLVGEQKKKKKKIFSFLAWPDQFVIILRPCFRQLDPPATYVSADGSIRMQSCPILFSRPPLFASARRAAAAKNREWMQASSSFVTFSLYEYDFQRVKEEEEGLSVEKLIALLIEIFILFF